MITRQALDRLYRRYNRVKYVHPDPLEFLFRYEDLRDREIAGLVASSLAYGRVAQILKSVEAVLGRMGRSPRRFVTATSPRTIAAMCAGFKHRVTTGCDMAELLVGIRNAVRTHGSLNECFMAGLGAHDETVLPAMVCFTRELGCTAPHLIPDPAKGSACKRLNLFLRWMVREDAVDPGGWHGVPREKLIVPMDTHMARISRELGFTRRKSADMTAALEVTSAFRAFAPEDPVKYDFVLTRFGIRPDLRPGMLKGELRAYPKTYWRRDAACFAAAARRV